MPPIQFLAGGALGAAGLLITLLAERAAMRLAGGAMALVGALIVLAGAAGLGAADGAGTPVTVTLSVALLAGVLSVGGARHILVSPKPVLAAIFFLLVIVAGCIQYLVLGAEFLAFALVIVYAGAILITYMFVLMLAHQATGDGTTSGAAYDHRPRDPVAACMVGLILFAGLASVMWKAVDGFDPVTADQIARARSWIALQSMPKGLEEAVQAAEPGASQVREGSMHVSAGDASVRVVGMDGSEKDITLPEQLRPTNTQTVGVALVSHFPGSLELAGVILLMAMLGAVVLARRQVELGDAKRAAAAAGTDGADPGATP